MYIYIYIYTHTYACTYTHMYYNYCVTSYYIIVYNRFPRPTERGAEQALASSAPAAAGSPPPVNQWNRNPRPQLEPQITGLDKCKINSIILDTPSY